MMSRSSFNQFLAGFTAALSVLMAGTSTGWITPLLVRLLGPDSPVPMTREQSSLVVSCVNIGTLVTPIPVGIFANSWGRKPCLLATAPLYIISWLLIIYTRTIPFLIIVRLMQGLSLGVVFAILPVYLAEIADPKIRGALSTLFSGMFNLGVLFEYVIGPYVSYENLAYCSLVIPIVFLVTFMWMPESPYFYLVRKREIEAADSLAWLRGENAAALSIKEELRQMKESVDDEMKGKASWKDIVTTPANCRALLCVQIVVLVEHMSGLPAVQTYASETFTTLSRSLLTPDQYTIILGTLILVVNLISATVVDSMGRRPLLLISAIGSGLSEVLAGIYFFLDTKTNINVSHESWLAVVFIAAYLVLISIGVSPLMTTLQAELFPANTRGVASGISGLVGTVASFICLFMYQNIAGSAGVYLNYWIFASFAFIGAILIFWLLPETKGKTFGEIQTEFNKVK